jgi:hypothetical protein
MASASEAILREPERRTAAWSALVLMLSLVGLFALFALYLDHDHAFADRLAASLPSPGSASSLAADPTLAAQLRVDRMSARIATLDDRSRALVADVRVTNDALIAVRHIFLEARALVGGRERSVVARCGHAVSNRLIGRMQRGELAALMELTPSDPGRLEPGESTQCQVAMVGLKDEVDEVTLRIASAEPVPGHPAPRFLARTSDPLRPGE